MSDGVLLNPYRFGAAFNPLTSITWENVYWAEDPSWTNPGDGNDVTSWRDGSGNARDLNSMNGARWPIFASTGLAGRPSIHLDGGATARGIKTAVHTIPGPFSLVAIWKTTNALNAADQHVLWRSGTTGIYSDAATDRLSALYAGAALKAAAANTNAARLTIGYVDTAGTSDALWVDGVAATGSAGNGGTASMATMLGHWTLGGDPPTDGDAAFLGIYSGDFRNDAQFAAFKTWASGLYGMTIV